MDDPGICAGVTILTAATFVSNTLLVLVTWKSKQLRTPCNLLIATDGFLQAFLAASYFPQVFLFPALLSESKFSNCFFVLSPILVSLESASLMPLMIAVERVINVFAPIWAQQRNKSKRYTVLMTAPAFAFGIALTTFYGCRILIEMPDKHFQCSVTAIYFSSEIASIAPNKNFGIIFLCWTAYGAIFVRLWLRSSTATTTTTNSAGDQVFRRVTRSLVAITSLITVCWLGVPATIVVLGAFSVQPATIAVWFQPIAYVSVDLAAVFMLPALCIFSKEYRKATAELFAQCKFDLIFCCFLSGADIGTNGDGGATIEAPVLLARGIPHRPLQADPLQRHEQHIVRL